MAHQPSAAFFGARLGVAIKERGNLRLDRPRQQGPGAAAQHLGAACKTLIDSERRKNTQASSDVGARQLARF